ncbi:MAG: PhoPQ-activated pathogenicity-related family protein [Verrucomicrobiales bacterium]
MKRFLCSLLAGLCGVAMSHGAETPNHEKTPLDEYVAKADPHYSYKLVNTLPGQGFTTFVLEMTSQKWLTTNEVDKPIWKHWMMVVRPDKVAHSTGLLFISGGSNKSPAPSQVDQNLVNLAVASQSVVTELRMVPNQPLVFKGETEGRVEDSLIAYTWDKFLRTGDPKWPARLPMTKSAVRAMDAITAFMATKEGGEKKVDTFVVAGASKRGWTTWSTAAVDKRVVAIVPIVIDLLNIEPSFKHHFAAYGFWAPAVRDYEEMGIMNWRDSKEYDALMKIEEPFYYKDRYTMPKLLLNAAGDQFFLPDSSQFYYHELPGKKYLRYVPNGDHSLRGTDAYMTLLAFHHAILNKKNLPDYSWSLPKEGVIRVTTKTKPAEVKLWQATNPDARDFRMDVIGKAYKSVSLQAQEDGSYIANVEKPEKGWTAYFVELTYPGEPAPLKLTTQVAVIPDILPFRDKIPEATKGTRKSGGK